MYSAISDVGSLAVSWSAVVNALEPTIDGNYMPFTTPRLYVPFVHLENPQAIISKPVKKVRYNDCYAQLFYRRAGIGKQSTQLNAAFNLQLSASVKNAKYVILFPFAEQTVRFETSTCASARNNALILVMTMTSTSLLMRYLIASINGDLTPQLANGLLDYQTWSLMNRVLIADVSRLIERDVPQAIQIQGTNAGWQGTNMIVLICE
ncbi:unnamed protein product [Phytophthora lilii]|uniref:Unnamed protein product n=1 Tax=Phytophthora lilii TaxID=2077276 RepID=A0A9W6WEK9_9STRA|nr:unnamed protein product [Phytophthora lilii]